MLNINRLFSISILIGCILSKIYRIGFRAFPRYIRGLEILDLYSEFKPIAGDTVIQWYLHPTMRADDRVCGAGLFILHNVTHDRYFIGVDDNMLEGVYWQLSGQGFNNVAIDVDKGHIWYATFIPKQDIYDTNIVDLWYDGIHAFKANHVEYGYHDVA